MEDKYGAQHDASLYATFIAGLDDEDEEAGTRAIEELTRGGQCNRRKMRTKVHLLQEFTLLVVVDTDAKLTLISPVSNIYAEAAAALAPNSRYRCNGADSDWDFRHVVRKKSAANSARRAGKARAEKIAQASTLQEDFEAFLKSVVNLDGHLVDCLEEVGGAVDVDDGGSGGNFPGDPPVFAEYTSADVSMDDLVPLVNEVHGKFSTSGNAVLLAVAFWTKITELLEGPPLRIAFTQKSTLYHLIKECPRLTADYIANNFRGLWMCDTTSLENLPSTDDRQQYGTAADDVAHYVMTELRTKRAIDVFPPPLMSELFRNKLAMEAVLEGHQLHTKRHSAYSDGL